MKLKVFLKVKFRAFFITFAQFEKQWEFLLNAPMQPNQLIAFNDRGVTLLVNIELPDLNSR